MHGHHEASMGLAGESAGGSRAQFRSSALLGAAAGLTALTGLTAATILADILFALKPSDSYKLQNDSIRTDLFASVGVRSVLNPQHCKLDHRFLSRCG